jgi:hypothetical protein
MTEREHETRINLGGKHKRKRPPRGPSYRWENNIKEDLNEIGCDGVEWNHASEDTVPWRHPVITIMKLWVS